VDGLWRGQIAKQHQCDDRLLGPIENKSDDISSKTQNFHHFLTKFWVENQSIWQRNIRALLFSCCHSAKKKKKKFAMTKCTQNMVVWSETRYQAKGLPKL
jgi:hypothetical protein